MHLFLSHRSVINAVYDNEDGQNIYKVRTPFKFKGRTSTISRILPNGIPRGADGDDIDMQDRFAHLAQIEWKTINSSRIRFGGNDVDVNTLFREEGGGWFGRDHLFTTPDGLEYRWVLGSTVPALYLNDEAKTPAARFHRRKRLGVFREARKASLEIFPAGEHIVDAVVVTFVYIEKLRKDREEAARSANGGGIVWPRIGPERFRVQVLHFG